MAVAAVQAPNCPRCHIAMIRAAGLDGCCWVCPKQPDHEFMEWNAAPATKALEKKTPTIPARCPRCRSPVKQDDLGPYCDGPDHSGIYRLPKDTDPYWLEKVGITAPLPAVRQGNVGDGKACQPLGTLKKGGGSKSGRKRKKPTKKISLSPFSS